jgi:exosome complex component RRP41
MISTFPRSEIDIFVEILNSDGGVLAASFNAVMLALINAGIPMIDYVVAVSAGNIQGQPLLDLNKLEEASNNSNSTVAFLPRTGAVAYMNVEPRLESDKLQGVLELARSGADKLWRILDGQVVRKYVSDLHQHARQSVSAPVPL